MKKSFLSLRLLLSGIGILSLMSGTSSYAMLRIFATAARCATAELSLVQSHYIGQGIDRGRIAFVRDLRKGDVPAKDAVFLAQYFSGTRYTAELSNAFSIVEDRVTDIEEAAGKHDKYRDAFDQFSREFREGYIALAQSATDRHPLIVTTVVDRRPEILKTPLSYNIGFGSIQTGTLLDQVRAEKAAATFDPDKAAILAQTEHQLRKRGAETMHEIENRKK